MKKIQGRVIDGFAVDVTATATAKKQKNTFFGSVITIAIAIVLAAFVYGFIDGFLSVM